ncbi:MAG: ABC transporter permease subunit [SAR324 cluster bacterium]|nr:ABC transporter permease subunit [SAR324 cluster bacterium]
MNWNPITLRQLKRFRSIRRGYYSLWIFGIMMFLAFSAEMWVNSRALMVYYSGQWYFPTYGDMIPGTVFGLDYSYETNYRELQKKFEKEKAGNWVLLPIAPYNAFETDLDATHFPPHPPSLEARHYLGTDSIGRDLLARLVYGFRVCILFSLMLLVINFSIGITVGCLMGYWGGAFDLIFQRVIEIWSSIPFLYVIMIISSMVVPNLTMLVLISVFFGWMGLTWYMRTLTYKEKARTYVLAAKALGAGNTRIILKHILPNSLSLIITFVPFSVAGGISSLTALDYLGFGLPAPTPSWGELLQQGTNNLHAPWIISSTVIALVVVLVTITFIGEAVREAFDPKMHTIFE